MNNLGRVLLGALLGVVFVLPTFNFSSLSWHDWQRAGQIIIFILCAFGLLASNKAIYLSRFYSRFFCFFLLIGLISSSFSQYRLWSLAEVSLLLGSIAIVFFIAWRCIGDGERFDFLIINFLMMLCLLKVLQFFVSYVSALSYGGGLSAEIILDGFSNIRFYGQFITLVIPVLAFKLLSSDDKLIRVGVFLLLSCIWLIAIASGTRGTWLGMGVAMLYMACLSRLSRKWACIQFSSFVFSLGLYFLFFSLIPRLLGLSVSGSALDRMTTTLSARDVIWLQALEMVKNRPLLGYGPMHFASIYNDVAAHPHQLFLQIASEWGGGALLIALITVIRFLLRNTATIKNGLLLNYKLQVLYVCLSASFIASLSQGMVDGVFVMPYSQIWFSIITGWMVGVYYRGNEQAEGAERLDGFIQVKIWKLSFLLASLILVAIVFRDLSYLNWQGGGGEINHWGYFKPRFWRQGIIAE
ncbi:MULTISPECIES: O-antigen ligase family protein [Pseudomonas]|uniref:O-Antigen ligase n=1 Tax=Pseudomonas lutea TaxID=243924 RepID=A0A9X8QI78_9PSED|nr:MULTISPECIES: O-antigen ligase family protein [Pseudomonas]SEP95529.1 O-Antigen ligase [Pseudomonas lutea]